MHLRDRGYQCVNAEPFWSGVRSGQSEWWEYGQGCRDMLVCLTIAQTSATPNMLMYGNAQRSKGLLELMCMYLLYLPSASCTGGNIVCGASQRMSELTGPAAGSVEGTCIWVFWHQVICYVLMLMCIHLCMFHSGVTIRVNPLAEIGACVCVLRPRIQLLPFGPCNSEMLDSYASRARYSSSHSVLS